MEASVQNPIYCHRTHYCSKIKCYKCMVVTAAIYLKFKATFKTTVDNTIAYDAR